MPKGPLLIVDDDPRNLSAMRQILSAEYALIFARDGAAALAAASRKAPALILLDIMMPDMDGFEVCKALKANPATARIPIIFVTGLIDSADETAGFALGAVDYIVKPLSPGVVRARVAAHLSLVHVSRLERSYHEAIAMLGMAGHYNDTDTGAHVWRMGGYARQLACAAGWSEQDCQTLELAAPMHDTGKIGIPSEILRKPDKLTADQWEVMKSHTRIGHAILSRSDADIFRLAAEIALHHHEHWDGSGYPHGLAGEAIPEAARIVAIVDVFDALTTKRPYKEPWPSERTLDTMQASRGTHFDPRLLDAFFSIMPRILEVKMGWDAREMVEGETNDGGFSPP